MTHHDVVIVGGGHNALTAAAYLALAGRDVLLLERDDHVGGAAISAEAFTGVDARLSRYSYLVSLLPKRIIDDLGLRIDLVRRAHSSYTPDPEDPARGLLIERDAAGGGAFARIDAADEAGAWSAFGNDTARLAESLFPTLTEPLPTRSEARRLVGDDRIWSEFIERPIGEAIESRFSNDLVRGVVATDALIGTFTDPNDGALDANRCFLYHVIGGGTGDWDVPVGGMGAVSGELARAARLAGARLETGAEVTSVSPDGSVSYRHDGVDHVATGTVILSGVAPHVLDRLVGAPEQPKPEGAQVKVNLLLSRLPRLRDTSVDPAAAFGGTFHVNETYSQLAAAHAAASVGTIPTPLPLEIYCHTLSDRSILGPELAETSAQTLTVFGLHTPDRLLDTHDPDELRAALQAAVIASLDAVLAEPIESLLLTDAAGAPTIETKTTRDIELALAMPGGNIFHGPLSWPFADDDAALTTPAERWGVATAHPRILVCGSGAVRGGAVSGIGGHNAAMAVLESL
ncbi:NAD(P)/FAD-dependent oxidoreductase [Agromyces atrinae]|uniref:phytoene desaturase family protein n=1 Tax=Agromyces atrinae TaxID=592376 RepID=UPI001F593CF5|nr:NAD(P)/FAD-dependent oxidoreductase [Agromyces atrinae]MCI2957015.1 NAD(P)/FAD-dependent oxidoreductase [Agromyces atrinae]